MTAAMLTVSKGAFSLPPIDKVLQANGSVQVSGKLSQTKLIQGGQKTVYMDVTITPPAMEMMIAPQRATDMIIVLDRSGSMSEANKMPYAKAAIRDVLSRLNNHDRFALVSFSNNAIVHSPLVPVDSAKREYLNGVVNSIVPSGGTNMSDGLNTALRIMANNDSQRAKKVLLLSDGQANQGITSLEGLSAITTRLTHTGSVLSSIGMGLNFNETLMAKLADYGMGYYAYLEDLSGLGQILARDLKDSRSIVANSSTLEIMLGDGVQLVDAGGYPLTRNGSTVSIASGQLLSNSDKHFVITFNIPTAHVGQFSLGQMRLVYQTQGKKYQAALNDESLMLAVVEPERREEAISSIDSEVYKQSWLKNNLGRMQKKLSHWVREGNKDKAEKVIADYRHAMEEAEVASNVPMASDEMDDKLDAMKSEVNEAFAGSHQDQEVKRKRASKSIQFGAIKEQRSIN
jgi:Ca-activated chloride channel family protein